MMCANPRRSTSLLLEKRELTVTYSDPFVPTLRLDGHSLQSKDLNTSAAAADCVVIVTDHTAFNYPELLKSARLIVDTRNALKPAESDKIVRL